jgi:hypothetical protein
MTWCQIGIHRWLKWVEVERGTVLTSQKQQVWEELAVGPSPKIETGTYLIQSRECEDCGRLQLRTVRTEL